MSRRKGSPAALSDADLLRGLPGKDRLLILVFTVLCAAAGFLVHPPLMAAFACVLAFAALLTAAVDIRFLLIPDRLTLAVLVTGIAAQIALGINEGQNPWFGTLWVERLTLSLMGLAAGALVIGGLRLFWLRVRGVEAIGFGDVKLAGALGAWLGPVDLFAALFVAACAGLLLYGMLRPVGGKADPHLPFGALFAPAAWLVFAFGIFAGFGAPY